MRNQDDAPVETHAEWALRMAKQRRLKAYADPETGSDRHFAEASRLEAMGQTIEAGQARVVGLTRYQEIKALYPTYEDQEPSVVPQSVTRSQGKAELITAGLWDAVLAFVDAIEDEAEKALALVALNDTARWSRDSEFLIQCSSAIGVTPEQMDDLFILAASIEL